MSRLKSSRRQVLRTCLGTAAEGQGLHREGAEAGRGSGGFSGFRLRV